VYNWFPAIQANSCCEAKASGTIQSFAYQQGHKTVLNKMFSS